VQALRRLAGSTDLGAELGEVHEMLREAVDAAPPTAVRAPAAGTRPRGSRRDARAVPRGGGASGVDDPRRAAGGARRRICAPCCSASRRRPSRTPASTPPPRRSR
jgi:hypothetical protein